MEAVVIQCDILNHSRYQLQITIPPRESTVVPELLMMWTIDSSRTDRTKRKTTIKKNKNKHRKNDSKKRQNDNTVAGSRNVCRDYN
jgi:hypothetical protein